LITQSLDPPAPAGPVFYHHRDAVRGHDDKELAGYGKSREAILP
jgi:hypothetical protein